MNDASTPSAPSTSAQPQPLFYGWILLAALMVGYTTTNGIIINTLQLFYPSLIQEFNVPISEVTRPATLQFALTALFALFFGPMLEKYSPKMIMVAGGFLLTAALLWFSVITSLTQMTFVYVLIALGLTASGIVSSMFLVARWFQKYRGRAVGILLMGSSLGTAIFPPVAGMLTKSFGWRGALLWLAGAMFVFVTLLFFVLVKNKPSDVGTTPDGAEAVADSRSQAATTGVTLSEAAKTPVFYMLCFVTAAMWFCIVGVLQNQTIYFKDLGVAELAPKALSVFGLAAMAGKLLFGWLSDKYSKKGIMLIATFNLLVGAVMLRSLASNPQTLLFPYAIVFGLGFSGAFTMIQVLVAEYYAGASYGKILGVFTFVDTMAGAAGIQTLSGMRSSTGSYDTPFLMLIVLCLVSLAIVSILKKPEPKPLVQPA
jgi:sugar phosphate permease